MYARQRAWLSCPVKDSTGKCTATTRQQQILADGGRVRLPHVQALQYLLPILNAIGWVQNTGAGLVPVTSTELRAYTTGRYRLTGFEFDAVLNASHAFVNEYLAANEAAPFGSLSDLSNPATLSQRFAKGFASLARRGRRVAPKNQTAR